MRLTIFVLLVILIIGMSLDTFAQQANSSVFIHKSVSQSILNWSDEVDISIAVINTGSTEVSNVMVIDTVPLGFSPALTEGITMENEHIVFHKNNLQPREETNFSYKIRPLEGMKSEKSIDVNLPRAKVLYDVGQNLQLNEESNLVKVTIKESKFWWEENISATVAMLVAISFASGVFGTWIHNQNLNFDKNNKEKVKQANQESKAPISTNSEKPSEKDQKSGKDESEKTQYHPLIGGVAGIVVLASFQGLSSLFANGQLQPTVQNIVVLIATSLAAGFTPVAVIDKMTSKFKTEAEEVKKQNMLLENTSKTAEKEKKQIEEDKNKYAVDNKQLKSESEKDKTTINWGSNTIEQLQAEVDDLKAQLSSFLLKNSKNTGGTKK